VAGVGCLGFGGWGGVAGLGGMGLGGCLAFEGKKPTLGTVAVADTYVHNIKQVSRTPLSPCLSAVAVSSDAAIVAPILCTP
jgi:hypothetical protein